MRTEKDTEQNILPDAAMQFISVPLPLQSFTCSVTDHPFTQI